MNDLYLTLIISVIVVGAVFIWFFILEWFGIFLKGRKCYYCQGEGERHYEYGVFDCHYCEGTGHLSPKKRTEMYEDLREWVKK
jgi:hypothetical protein